MEASAPPRLRVFVLGRFRVERGEHVVGASEWGRRGAAPTLVKLLAVQRHHQIHRDELLELLWTDVDLDSARNRLSKALHAARRALEPGLEPRAESAYLHLTGEILSLDPSTVWIDTDEFEAFARDALQAGEIRSLRAAARAYSGDLLPEDRYEDWSLLPRQVLSERHEQVLAALASRLHQAGEREEAQRLWQQIVTENPLREDIHRALMRAYADRGLRAQALRQYDLCRQALLQEVGVDPEPETEMLYRGLAAVVELPPIVEAEPGPTAPALPAAVRRPPAIPLIGRDRLLAILRDDLAEAMRGSGRLILIEGEAGIGKSRLMVEIVRHAQSDGAAVLWGASTALEQRSPYRPLVEALESYLIGLAPEDRAALAARYPQLSLLIPSLGPVTAGPPVDLGPEMLRGMLTAQLVSMFAGIAGRQPLVLALDDVHGADAASLDLLHQLARAGLDHPWLIVASYRNEQAEMGSSLFALLAAFGREALGRRVTLGRLSRQDTGRLAEAILGGGRLEEALLDHLHGLSHGNPLFLVEVTRALHEEGDLQFDAGRWTLSPGSGVAVHGRIADVVAARFDTLGPEVHQILTLAAVKGLEFTLSTLLTAAEIAFGGAYDRERLLSLVDRALATGMLEDRGEIYAFPHVLIRTALLERLPSHRRARLHSAVAQALERERPGEMQRLAYHFSRSDAPEKAIPYVGRAGRRADQLFANEEASRHFADLVQLLDRTDQAIEAARARQLLAQVLARMARYDNALAALERAAEAYAALGHSDLPLAVGQIGHVHHLRGTAREGLERIAELSTLIDPGLSSMAAVHASRAALYWQCGRYSYQLAAAAAALDLVTGMEPSSTREEIALEADLWRGIGLVALERTEEGIAVLEAVLPRAQARAQLLQVSRAANTLAAAYRERGDRPRQEAYLDRALDAARLLGDPARLAYMLFRRGRHRWLLGDWRGAREDLEQAALLVHDTPRTWARPYLSLGLAMLSASEGRSSEAQEHIEQALQHACAAGDLRARVAAECLRAEEDLAEGRPAAAVAALKRLAAMPDLKRQTSMYVTALLARACLDAGLEADAASRSAAALACAREGDDPSALAEALATSAAVCLGVGNTESALAHAIEAVALSRDLAHPLSIGRALLTLGRVQRRAGEPTEARASLQEARTIFHRLGAQRDLERTETELRAFEPGGRVA